MTRSQVPILMYHALGERSVITIPETDFAWQMQWLHKQGFQGISMGRLARCLRNGTPLPARSVAITFDDGFDSVYTHALPILAQYGFPATVFLVTGHCGGRNDWPGQAEGIPLLPLMTWDQVKEMDRLGIEFGAHTHTHPRLDQLSAERATHEILDSRAQIEDRLGHAVEVFAYPYGRYNAAVKGLLERSFVGACSAQPGLVTPESDPFELARVDFNYVSPGWVFRQLARPGFRHYLSVRRNLRTLASFVLRRPWD